MKKILSALLVLSLLTPNSSIKPLNAENSVLVDEASTLEEKALAALKEVKINTDLNTVVSDLYIPTTGLFNSAISWKSSNDDFAEVDEEATANRKETLLTTAQTEYFNNLLETWVADYPLTVVDSVWEQVVFDRSYEMAQ